MREDSLQILYRLDPNPRKAYSKADELKYYIDVLEEKMLRQRTTINGWQFRLCEYHSHGNYTYLHDWEDIAPGVLWGGPEMTGMFKSTAFMPEPLEEAQVFIELDFGGEGLLCINGTPHQGVDFDRKIANLDRYFKPGEQLDIALEVSVRNAPYDAFRQDIRVHHVFQKAEIIQIDKTIEDLYYYCWALYDVANASEDEEYKSFILDNLQAALKLVNYAAKDFEGFKSGVPAAVAYIKEKIYTNTEFKRPGKLALIGQSHLDLVYLWPYKEYVRKNPRTAMNMVRNIDEFPEFIFSQSQGKLYEDLRIQFPVAYDAVKKKIKEGSWEPVGAFYVEPDCNLISGESVIRQIMWGKKYYQQEFGIDPQICWVPDVFGCMWTIPQLLVKSGVKYMSTIKLSIWNDTNEFPYSQFWWEGPDGSRVLTYFPGTHFVSSAEPKKIWEAWDKNKQRTLTGEGFYQFGLADGGGGATRDMVARMTRLRGLPGLPELEFDTLTRFFERLETKSQGLPVWQDELYLETHRGTYTTKGQIKKANRQGEFGLRDAEFYSVVAKSLGGASMKERLDLAWKNLMVNQFHDILPGSHVTEAAGDAIALYDEMFAIINGVKTECLSVIVQSLPGGKDLFAVFNTLSFARTDWVEVTLPTPHSHVSAVDKKDGEILHTVCSVENGVTKVCFAAVDVPPMGYKVYEIKPIETEAVMNQTVPETASAASNSLPFIETNHFRVQFDVNGNISSLYDKVYGREIITGGAANRFQIFEDRPGKYSAWDIISSYEDYEYTHACKLISLETVEQNASRTVVKCRQSVLDSEITQHIIFYNDIHRIDFDTQVEWRECEKLLKVSFPVSVRARNATYDIPFGTISRSTHRSTSWDRAKFEVCAHKWADLSEFGFGVALLNDCKYGCDVRDNVIRLTLLKAPVYPDPVSDRGSHNFRYSLYPHGGDWREGKVMEAGYGVNAPLAAIPLSEESQNGKFAHSWFETEKDGIIIEAVKEAEDGEGCILRAYDAYGGSVTTDITTDISGSRAEITDMMESPIKPVEYDGKKITLTLSPYEIVTVRVV
ncbi:MAG: glycosyl hydrolase-related protein [Defluviitaleaceae bacterium]|nr:glycosyl hydrolase-related protein [Defluviitaleaceae bacterium]